MPCYHPLVGWYAKERTKNGKRAVTFRFAEAYKDRPLPVPCGKCVGCKLEKARQWAMRCMHEASMWEDNVFLTLTYDDEHLPSNGSLCPEHMVKFLKRLRRRYVHQIRFFQCGEYGEKLQRPHHHVILFNHDFDDKRLLRSGGDKNRLYESKELSRLWPYGMHSIGAVTFQTAGYIARYTLKKVDTGADEWYNGKVREYLTMSRRPGIGRSWIEMFAKQVYKRDQVIVNGCVSKPTRYYDEVAAKMMPDRMERIKLRRRALGSKNEHNSGRRLIEREEVKRGMIVTLDRSYENG